MSRFSTPTLRKLAWSIGVSSTVLLLGAFAFAFVDRHANLPPDEQVWNVPDVLSLFTNLAVPLLGLVLAIRRPRNPIGWLFLTAGAGLAPPVSRAGSM